MNAASSTNSCSAQRYAPQLETYAKLLRQLEDRPIRLALYFPLLDELLSWDFAG